MKKAQPGLGQQVQTRLGTVPSRGAQGPLEQGEERGETAAVTESEPKTLRPSVTPCGGPGSPGPGTQEAGVGPERRTKGRRGRTLPGGQTPGVKVKVRRATRQQSSNKGRGAAEHEPHTDGEEGFQLTPG